MDRRTYIGLITGAVVCFTFTLAGSLTPAGAKDTGLQVAPNVASGSTEQAGTAFTFQGQLKKDGGAFNGACGFRFTLFDAATAGAQVGAPQTVDVTVVNGLFTAPLDFGNQFTGQARWLETAVKCAGDADFIPQSPRLTMTSSPYAIGLVPGAVVQGATNKPGDAVFWVKNADVVVGAAVRGDSTGGFGVRGNGAVGVEGSGQTTGVDGYSENGTGVFGSSTNATGIHGASYDDKAAGILGDNYFGGPGVRGHSSGNAGVYGTSENAFGVYGESDNNYAIKGKSLNSVALYGESTNSAGVYGLSSTHHGVIGRTLDPTKYAILADGKVAITGGTDIAERFSSAISQTIEPGTVVVVDEAHPGQVNPSNLAYARTVVGIVSGAGGVEPGLVLHQKGMMEGPHIVAIAGRVYVKATTINGSIKPGDLLTTADLPGHAMKATDRDLAFGAIIGKALTGLDNGADMVLVLVNLQ